jgi:CBS domain-containing protein
MSLHGLPVVLNAREARDMMTPNPVTIHEEAALDEAAKLLSERGFTAAPVVDHQGRVVGVVSQTDLVRAQANPRTSPRLSADSSRDPDDEHAVSGISFTPATRVSQVMNHAIYSVSPDTPAQTVVQEMVRRRIRRVFVVDNHRALVGVISAFDVLALLTP